jgi:hypothetical protein
MQELEHSLEVIENFYIAKKQEPGKLFPILVPYIIRNG